MFSKYAPLNFQKWLDENRHLLKPPVGNKLIWQDREFMVMAVGGPNVRTDYHYNEGEEIFYQVEGTMTLKIVDDAGKFRDIQIAEGEIYLLPPRTPHSPRRPANTVGVVIERKRLAHEKDGFMWFCENCGEKLYEEFFTLTNIETQFPEAFDRFNNSDKTICKKCGLENVKDNAKNRHPYPYSAARDSEI